MFDIREALKKQKLLRIKCKEMVSQNQSKRYEGIIDFADMNRWPAPLKIAHQTIDSMKDFRVCIQCVHIYKPRTYVYVYINPCYKH